ncbi:hypothetical protein BO86DRAFT_238669 [Aspergillus japonicus CBS 114.51]|uniref:Uncharacterized protein n=1 Tax=Aspergillus japonicus CBS 114.51 TaxID=1448312 RepID=A0A8T8WM12_ASPJA|nr:hypothetical protein BO86DRAFT_238669 [Aspergillus japonicus CBS 114.51]RAH76806.1 hypothetical protein BO86DRAFT_238669 [Aspergillus japonicus CBS 114.51]
MTEFSAWLELCFQSLVYIPSNHYLPVLVVEFIIILATAEKSPAACCWCFSCFSCSSSCCCCCCRLSSSQSDFLIPGQEEKKKNRIHVFCSLPFRCPPLSLPAFPLALSPFLGLETFFFLPVPSSSLPPPSPPVLFSLSLSSRFGTIAFLLCYPIFSFPFHFPFPFPSPPPLYPPSLIPSSTHSLLPPPPPSPTLFISLTPDLICLSCLKGEKLLSVTACHSASFTRGRSY